jgi:negative regulator of sigma E activity
VITEKQRRRALARAKWERQQAKRTAAAKRTRAMSIVFGVAASVVAIVFVGWGVHHLVTDDSTPSTPTIPINTITPINQPGVTDTKFGVSYSPPTTGATATTGSGATTGPRTSTKGTTPVTTTPATSGATGTSQP